MSDGIIEARFFNPYSATVGEWSSGFLFRHQDTEGTRTTNFTSSSYVPTEATTTTCVRADAYPSRISAWRVRQIGEIDTEPGGSNHIQVVADGKKGKLYVNGLYIADLQLQGLLGEGGVYAVGSYFNSDGVDGHSTKFEDFTIWPIDSLR